MIKAQRFQPPIKQALSPVQLQMTLNSNIPTKMKTTVLNNLFKKHCRHIAEQYQLHEYLEKTYFQKLLAEQAQEKARKNALDLRQTIRVDLGSLQQQLNIFYTLFLLNCYHRSHYNISPYYFFPYYRSFIYRMANAFIGLIKQLAYVLTNKNYISIVSISSKN